MRVHAVTEKGHVTLQAAYELNSHLLKTIQAEIRDHLSEPNEVEVAALAVDIARALASAGYVIGRVHWLET